MALCIPAICAAVHRSHAAFQSRSGFSRLQLGLWWFQPGKPPPLVLDVQRQKRDGFEDGLRLRLRGVVDEPLGAGALCYLDQGRDRISAALKQAPVFVVWLRSSRPPEYLALDAAAPTAGLTAGAGMACWKDELHAQPPRPHAVALVHAPGSMRPVPGHPIRPALHQLLADKGRLHDVPRFGQSVLLVPRETCSSTWAHRLTSSPTFQARTTQAGSWGNCSSGICRRISKQAISVKIRR
jgi:hypothetical protein